MVAELDSDSPQKTSTIEMKPASTDINGCANMAKDVQPTVSPSKRRRLENLVQGLTSSATTGSENIREKGESANFRPSDVMGFHHDIFNTDSDRQELINYCEKMLEDCKHPTQHNYSAGTESTSISNTDVSTTHINPEDEWSQFDDIDPETYKNAFDDGFEDQQLKSAYYFDGERFVSIQVILDIHTGECQLLLPIDHPDHHGVPEEVPIFETRRVPVEDLKQ